MRLITFTILLLFTACSTAEQDPVLSEEVITISVNLDEAAQLYMSEFFSELRYIHLETPEERPIGRIRKIIVKDDVIGLFDRARHSVWVYTTEGEYVNEVNIPRGRGPGELEEITDVIITRDGQVHALGTFKVVAYDLEGRFVGETGYRFRAYRFTYDRNSGEYIGYASNSMNTILDDEHAGHNLLFFDKDGTITDSFLPIGTGREQMGFNISNRFPVYGNYQLFFPHLVDTVYTLGNSGVKPRYVLDYGRHSIPEEVFGRRGNYSSLIYEWQEFREREITANNYVSGLSMFNETDLFIHFRFHAGGNQYNAIYDKERGVTHVGGARLTNDIDYGYVPFIYDSSDEALYTIIEAADLIDHLHDLYENEPETYAHPNTQSLVRLAHSVSENSNPVLQVATFKTTE
jgi:hypothetical protein